MYNRNVYFKASISAYLMAIVMFKPANLEQVLDIRDTRIEVLSTGFAIALEVGTQFLLVVMLAQLVRDTMMTSIRYCATCVCKCRTYINAKSDVQTF